ncbi:hypothetical protein GCK32_022340, partial [Trichostrongylus colubriformis]
LFNPQLHLDSSFPKVEQERASKAGDVPNGKAKRKISKEKTAPVGEQSTQRDQDDSTSSRPVDKATKLEPADTQRDHDGVVTPPSIQSKDAAMLA